MVEPQSSDEFSKTYSRMWASGRDVSRPSPGPMKGCTTTLTLGTEAMTLRCFRGTPLGVPVEPDVYMMQHRSSGLGGTGSAGFSSPSLARASTLVMEMWG